MQMLEDHGCMGGRQLILEHSSAILGCRMRLGVFLPPGMRGDEPILYFLSGLTCTEQNATTKAGAQRRCAERGMILVTPDTSPRGEALPDCEDWDLGQGAAFYLSATQSPWATHFRMDRYILDELPELLSTWTSSQRSGLTGHSMGGHGALVLSLRNPGRFQSVSAISPILHPSVVPWGIKAFTAYLGPDPEAWAGWDATRLVPEAVERLVLRIDQGEQDAFLQEQLDPTEFLAACERAGHPVRYRQHPGYDHSYYFVASVIDAHVDHHADALLGPMGGSA